MTRLEDVIIRTGGFGADFPLVGEPRHVVVDLSDILEGHHQLLGVRLPVRFYPERTEWTAAQKSAFFKSHRLSGFDLYEESEWFDPLRGLQATSPESEAQPVPESEAQPDGPDLQDALDDLYGIIDEARDDGYDVPSQDLVDQAEQVLRMMYEYHALRYEAYPMPDGSITLEGAWPTNLDRCIAVNLETDGQALCFFDTDDGHSLRMYFDCANDLIDKCYLREALADLAPDET